VILRFLVRLVALLLLAYLLGYAAFAVMLPRAAGEERTDAVVVLTGGTGRLDRGFELIGAERAQRLLVSGVERTVRPQELAAAYDLPIALFDCCIDLGRESFDTRSNADEVARWMDENGFTSMRLVTNDWHMPRARYELRRRLPDTISILPDAVETSPSFRLLFLEYNKYLLGAAADLAGI
jgi:uncharacterized SAM-binding protein YcdF (DUF218 family)